MKFTKTPAVLIATHGPFCEGLATTARMILGNIKDLEVLPLMEGMDTAEYEQQMDKIVERHNGNIVICMDLVGGTPYNTVLKLSRKWELCAVAGVNLPMIFRAIELRMIDDERDSSVFASQITNAAEEGVKNMNADLEMFHKLAQSQQ